MTAETLTEAELKARYERFVEQVWEGGDLDRIPEYVAEDYVEHNPVVPHEIRGADGYRQNVEMLFSAFPDMEGDIEDLLVDGDRVVARMTNRGTHEGEFVGFPPTGESFEISAIEIARFDGGKIAEMWLQVDALGMMTQLGIGGGPGAEAPE